jgi:acetyl esterase/lipase
MKRIILLLAASLCLSACTDLLNASISHDGYALYRDIAYGSDPRQKLDIYVPEGANNAPTIVFFYGGSWQMGSKDDYRFLGQALANRGFVTVVADYRLYPQVYYPDFVKDGARAFAYAHAHIAEFGGDPSHIYVAGHSAGGFIAMMLAADDSYLLQAGGKPAWIHGTIGIAGPYDFLPFTDGKIKAIFSKYPAKETQPINHITHKMAPVMLAVGNTDDIVDPRNSYRVAAKLKALHSPVIVHTYDDTGHIGIILSMAQGFRSRTPLLNDITRFVRTDGKD